MNDAFLYIKDIFMSRKITFIGINKCKYLKFWAHCLTITTLLNNIKI